MAFLNPFFLLGAMAAALPILIHLVRRARARRVPFASLMFLRRIEQKTIRKRRLRNLALLAMRCAALLLLALAFARPYFTEQSAAAGASGPSSVILLDGSYSMRYSGAFDRAKQAARNVIDEAGVDEKIALALFSQGHEILMPLKANRAEAIALLGQAQPGLGATDYLQAAQAADSILKEAGPDARKIYLISDFQQSGWNRAAPPLKLSPGVDLIPVDVSAAQARNLAVTEIKAEPVIYAQKYPGKLIARVANFSAGPVTDAAVEFKLNDLAVERRRAEIGANTSIAVELTGFNVPEGSNRASVEITGDDFSLDNKFSFTIQRDNQTRVLAIETPSRGRSESFFIQQSLLAGDNNQYALALKTPGTINPSELDSYRVVIVNDASGISEPLVAALKNFVTRGGGLIIAAGKHTEPDDFNRAFGEISPAQIGEAVQMRGGYALMSQVKMEHPIFSVFARSGRLTSTRVYAYHRATIKEQASVIAALDDASPLIIEGSAGSGKALLITTTLDTAWNDLPVTPMFLPFTRQMLEYLSGRNRASAYTVGQSFNAPPAIDGSLPSIENPGGGRVEEARKNSAGELMVTATETGFYRLRYRDRSDYVAVNLDSKEADFSKLDIDEFVASILPEPGSQNARATSPERLTAEDIESRQRLWLPLLIAALALFLAEAALAPHKTGEACRMKHRPNVA